MSSSSRFLIAFGTAIGVLIIAAVVLVLTLGGKESAPLLSEDTPEGTVQRYLIALEEEDYPKAYSYLSTEAIEEQSFYDSYEKWSQSFSGRRDDPTWKATLGESSVTGDTATVEVTIDTFNPRGPFEDPVSSRIYTFRLKKEGASWKITAPIQPLYFY